MAAGRQGVWVVLVVLSLTTPALAADAGLVPAPSQSPSTACCGITDPATCEADPAQGDELWTESAGPCWTVTADALFLHRSATRGPSLLVDPLGNVDPLKSSDLTFSTEAGPRLSVIRHGSCGWDFEVNYFGIDGWKSQAEFAAMPAAVAILRMDQSLPLPVSSAAFAYQSKLYSTEFNLRHAAGDCLTTMAGFRWVELDEHYRVDGMQSIGQSFSNTIGTHNHMYGFQVGAEAVFLSNCRFHIDGVAKVGVYYDAADQRDAFLRPSSNLDAAATGSRTSFLGELGLMGTYQLNNHLAVRGGYQLMWIEGVALAPRQIPVTNLGTGVAAVDTSGGIFYHGANVGLELSW